MNICKNTLLALVTILSFTACGEEAIDSDAIDSDTLPMDLAEEIPDGVRHDSVDGIETWYLDGAAAHEWYRDQLIERAQTETDPAHEALTWEVIEVIEENLDTMTDDPGDEVLFRAKKVDVKLSALSSNGKIGWKSEAKAYKSGAPANLRVETKVLTGNLLDENNDSTWGWGWISKSSQSSMVAPPACYARAYARSGSSSTVQETFNCPAAQVNPCTWTSWLDRDDPSGLGDYEDLNSFLSQGVCSNPTDIQCETTSGVPYNQTGEVVTCTPSTGGTCINTNQPDGNCQDYRVKFCCP